MVKKRNCIVCRIPVGKWPWRSGATKATLVPRNTPVVGSKGFQLGIKHGVIHHEPVAEQHNRPIAACV